MPKPKKDGVHINYYIAKDVKEMLDRYCDEMGQTNTLAIERILRGYLTVYFGKREKASIERATHEATIWAE